MLPASDGEINVNKNTYQKVSYAGDIDGMFEGCITMGIGYVYRLHRFGKVSNFSPIRHN